MIKKEIVKAARSLKMREQDVLHFAMIETDKANQTDLNEAGLKYESKADLANKLWLSIK